MPISLAVGPSVSRDERPYPPDRVIDQRTVGQRDRDRIMNTSAFRRLAGVTQVVSVAEGHLFHNRLTHSLEVAQIGRRIAENLIDTQRSAAERLQGLDPETVEAACLAHDLGHPPFGHIGETELHDAVVAREATAGGFEGNAQSFRIVTRLAVRHEEFFGLNLSRATLNAILKYPWVQGAPDAEREDKWGAYESDSELFRFARAHETDTRKCLEAEIMDWADDIAYAVHDAEDFYRAGLVPLDRLSDVEDTRTEREIDQGKQPNYVAPELEGFVKGVFDLWTRDPKTKPKSFKLTYEDSVPLLGQLFGMVRIYEPYSGTRDQRGALRTWTSKLIGEFVRAIKISDEEAGPRVLIPPKNKAEVDLLKQLTWQYVILNPALAAQQFGQRKVIRELFEFFAGAAFADPMSSTRRILPRGVGDTLAKMEEEAGAKDIGGVARARIAADAVAGLTEQQALDLHQRLTGHDTTSVFDPIVR